MIRIVMMKMRNNDVRAVFLIVALNGRCIGVTAVDGNRLRDPVAADGFLQKAQRGLFIAVLREQKVNGLALLIQGNRISRCRSTCCILYG